MATEHVQEEPVNMEEAEVSRPAIVHLEMAVQIVACKDVIKFSIDGDAAGEDGLRVRLNEVRLTTHQVLQVFAAQRMSVCKREYSHEGRGDPLGTGTC